MNRRMLFAVCASEPRHGISRFRYGIFGDGWTDGRRFRFRAASRRYFLTPFTLCAKVRMRLVIFEKRDFRTTGTPLLTARFSDAAS